MPPLGAARPYCQLPVEESGGALQRRWARAVLLAHTVRDLGVRTTGQVVAHTVRRRRLGVSEWAGRAATGPPEEPGRLIEATRVAGGARFVFSAAELEVVFPAPDVARVTWGPGGVAHPYAVSAPAQWEAPEAVLARAEEGAWTVTAGSFALEVGAEGSLRWGRPGGTVLRRELPPRRRQGSWEHRFLARPGERLSGLGEQAAGVDLRGGTYRLWNRDPGGSWGPGQVPLYVGIPVVVGSHPDGDLLAFYDNPASATVRLPAPGDDAGEASLSFAGGPLRVYVVHGPLPVLLERYSALTGRPALPPRWALGYHQSRWGYRRQAVVEEVLEGFRAMGVPLSALHLDIDHMDGYRVFTVDRRRFPDAAGLAARAEDQGTRLVRIVDPAVKVDHRFPLYREGVAQRLFCTDGAGDLEVGVVWPGKAVFPDFTDPACRRWWAAQYRRLTDDGVGGVWHDMNEPTSISLVGDPTLPLATRHRMEGGGGDHAEAHNLYGRLMNEAGHAGLRAARPDRRPFVVSRSGWAGNQRWAWNWTGDVESSWEGLRQQVATVLGFGLSGIAYAGPDIGGFSGAPSPELYLRWLQLAVCLPFCRTHSIIGAPPREPWRFPEPARSAVAAWIRFRYRLLPWLYALAHEAAETGAPLVRPSFWPAPGEGSSAPPAPGGAEDDTFLLGDALLVAPVTEAGATGRMVTLPPGTWHPVWGPSGPGLSGTHELPAPLERIPVLARAGSVVVLDDGWAEPGGPCRIDGDADGDGGGEPSGRPPTVAFDHAPRLFALHCWPLAGAASGSAADDAGDGDGPVRRDRFELADAVEGGTAVLRWSRAGQFPPPGRVRVVLHGLEVGAAVADGTPVPVEGGAVVCGPFEELRLEGLAPR